LIDLIPHYHFLMPRRGYPLVEKTFAHKNSMPRRGYLLVMNSKFISTQTLCKYA
jgi:hypothetical protein